MRCYFGSRVWQSAINGKALPQLNSTLRMAPGRWFQHPLPPQPLRYQRVATSLVMYRVWVGSPRASPKSTIFTVPVLVSSRFSGFGPRRPQRAPHTPVAGAPPPHRGVDR